MVRFRTFFLCLLAFSSVLFAQFETLSSNILDEKSLQASVEKITLENYPDANEVVIEDVKKILYLADGRYKTVNDYAFVVLTEKGRTDAQIQMIRYDISYEKAAFDSIRVIHPDGTAEKVDLKTQAQEMTENSQMGANIYNPNAKIMFVQIPNLEIGDIVRVGWNEEMLHPRIPNAFFCEEGFQHTSPIVHMSVEVAGPISLPLQKAVVKNSVGNGVKDSRWQKDGMNFYKWEASDVPQIIPEPDMVEWGRCAQHLLASTYAGWDEVSKWYWKLCEPHLKVNDDIREKVAELTSSLQSNSDKIQAIFQFVSQQIRYMGVTAETEAPGYEPHDVTLTFGNRYGVCRDKAALLAAMLRTAGLDAYPVLIYAGGHRDESVPLPWFNHAITAVKNADGSFLLMDSTDETTRDLFPKYLTNCSYIIAHPDGETLALSPVEPASENLLSITTHGKLDDKGEMMIDSRLKFSGINDRMYRGAFLEMTPEKRFEFLQRTLKYQNPSSRLLQYDILPSNLQNTLVPLEITLRFSVSDVMMTEQAEPENGDVAVFVPPMLSGCFGFHRVLLNKDNTGLEKRKYPLKLDTTVGVQEYADYELPFTYGAGVEAPQYHQIDKAGIHWNRTCSISQGQVSIFNEYSINQLEFSPEEYQELKKGIRLMDANNRRRMVLKYGGTQGGAVVSADDAEDASRQADYEIIDHRISYKIESDNAWTTTLYEKVQVLTYSGVKQMSDWSFSYNPVWEDVKLDFATVKNGNSVQKVTNLEMNVMDQEWVAMAPRYPAGKILVVNMPGVQVGSVIELQLVHTYRNQRQFLAERIFQQNGPVAYAKLTVEADEKMPLEMKAFPQGLAEAGDKKLNIQEACFQLPENRVRYMWEVNGLPAVHNELATPDLRFFVPYVFVGTGTWKEYAKLISERADSYTGNGKNMDGLVAMLAQYSGDEQLNMLRTYVERFVETVPVSLASMPLEYLSDPETTLREGYGHSADKALVYYCALKRLGYAPSLYLASTTTERFPEAIAQLKNCPDYSAFDSMLVRLKLKNQHDIWFNSLSEYDMAGASNLENCVLLDIASGKITQLLVAPEMEKNTQVNYVIEVAADGTAQVTYSEKLYGTAYGHLKERFAKSTPEELSRMFEQTVAALSPSAIAISKKPEVNFDEYPATLTYTVKIPDFAVVDGEFSYFSLPEFPGLGAAYSEVRYNPVVRNHRNRAFITYNLRFSSVFPEIVLCPREFTWISPDKASRASLKYLNNPKDYTGELRLETQLDLAPSLIPLAHYGTLLDLQNFLLRKSSVFFMLRKRK